LVVGTEVKHDVRPAILLLCFYVTYFKHLGYEYLQ
jgi:hypothetical protein